jgi:hypothetical protein
MEGWEKQKWHFPVDLYGVIHLQYTLAPCVRFAAHSRVAITSMRISDVQRPNMRQGPTKGDLSHAGGRACHVVHLLLTASSVEWYIVSSYSKIAQNHYYRAFPSPPRTRQIGPEWRTPRVATEGKINTINGPNQWEGTE